METSKKIEKSSVTEKKVTFAPTPTAEELEFEFEFPDIVSRGIAYSVKKLREYFEVKATTSKGNYVWIEEFIPSQAKVEPLLLELLKNNANLITQEFTALKLSNESKKNLEYMRPGIAWAAYKRLYTTMMATCYHTVVSHLFSRWVTLQTVANMGFLIMSRKYLVLSREYLTLWYRATIAFMEEVHGDDNELYNMACNLTFNGVIIMIHYFLHLSSQCYYSDYKKTQKDPEIASKITHIMELTIDNPFSRVTLNTLNKAMLTEQALETLNVLMKGQIVLGRDIDLEDDLLFVNEPVSNMHNGSLKNIANDVEVFCNSFYYVAYKIVALFLSKVSGIENVSVAEYTKKIFSTWPRLEETDVENKRMLASACKKIKEQEELFDRTLEYNMAYHLGAFTSSSFFRTSFMSTPKDFEKSFTKAVNARTVSSQPILTFYLPQIRNALRASVLEIYSNMLRMFGIRTIIKATYARNEDAVDVILRHIPKPTKTASRYGSSVYVSTAEGVATKGESIMLSTIAVMRKINTHYTFTTNGAHKKRNSYRVELMASGRHCKLVLIQWNINVFLQAVKALEGSKFSYADSPLGGPSRHLLESMLKNTEISKILDRMQILSNILIDRGMTQVVTKGTGQHIWNDKRALLAPVLDYCQSTLLGQVKMVLNTIYSSIKYDTRAAVQIDNWSKCSSDSSYVKKYGSDNTIRSTGTVEVTEEVIKDILDVPTGKIVSLWDPIELPHKKTNRDTKLSFLNIGMNKDDNENQVRMLVHENMNKTIYKSENIEALKKLQALLQETEVYFHEKAGREGIPSVHNTFEKFCADFVLSIKDVSLAAFDMESFSQSLLDWKASYEQY